MMGGDAIVAHARACVGARFRPHGRDPRWGLDCVGVAAAAFGREVAGDYPLRGGDPDAVSRAIAALGLRRIAPDLAAAGDLVLMAAGPEQLHLAVLTERGFVHADAGLRRVVETPGRPVLAVIGAWREKR
ncbi:peptidoglycan endopeptidase [Sphingomonas sp.]|uniref:peptidoglycan endopeptidase n=1 Tax=Sphingomonas sp. TaxID=28214 RepID=UPI003B3A3A36